MIPRVVSVPYLETSPLFHRCTTFSACWEMALGRLMSAVRTA